jgi:hypothetical protein
MLPAISLVGFLSAFLLLHFTDRVNVANRYLAYHLRIGRLLFRIMKHYARFRPFIIFPFIY